jgi:hypothetical protein
MKKIDSKTLIIVLMLLIIVSLIAGGYYYTQTMNTNPAQKELKETLKSLGEIMVLPEGETPTLATVTDPEKLKDQPFFANAKAGDKILIFTTSKKIILYSPTLNKIVEVGTTGETGN